MSIEKEMKVICRAIREDEGYRIGWKANIATSFYDEFRRQVGYEKVTNEQLHKVSNDAAENFLNLLTRDIEKPKKLSLRDSFSLFLADFKASMNK